MTPTPRPSGVGRADRARAWAEVWSCRQRERNHPAQRRLVRSRRDDLRRQRCTPSEVCGRDESHGQRTRPAIEFGVSKPAPCRSGRAVALPTAAGMPPARHGPICPAGSRRSPGETNGPLVGGADEQRLADWLADDVCSVEPRDERQRDALLSRCREERLEPPGRIGRLIGSARRLADGRFCARTVARLPEAASSTDSRS